jgi:hypothetical protein
MWCCIGFFAGSDWVFYAAHPATGTGKARDEQNVRLTILPSTGALVVFLVGLRLSFVQ